MCLCGVKDEEHTGHGQPVEGSNYSLLFRACETASGVLCPVWAPNYEADAEVSVEGY